MFIDHVVYLAKTVSIIFEVGSSPPEKCILAERLESVGNFNLHILSNKGWWLIIYLIYSIFV